MSFYVDNNELREFKYSVITQLSTISQGLDDVDFTLSNIILNPAMEGAGADGIYSYLYDMIINTMPIISTVIADLTTKISVLEAGIYEIDSSPYCVLPEEEIQCVIEGYSTASGDACEISGNVGGILNEISDICDLTVPDSSKYIETLDSVVNDGTTIISAVTDLDEAHYNNELVQLEELLDSAIAYIKALNDQSWNVMLYQMGNVNILPEYTALSEEITDTVEYFQNNQEKLVQANALCDAKLEEVYADGRIDEGTLKLIAGMDTAGIGAGILATTINPPVGLTILAGILLTLGGYEAVEGAQDIAYGRMGDAHTESSNLLKDLAGEKNYYAALIMGDLISLGYAAKSVYDLVKLRHAKPDILPGASVVDNMASVGNVDYSDLSTLGKVDDVVESGTSLQKQIQEIKTKTPQQLIAEGWQDVTDPRMATNTSSRELLDPKTGLKIRYDQGVKSATGFEAVDHYHIYNKNYTNKKVDYYFDSNGNPVGKGSNASHIVIGGEK